MTLRIRLSSTDQAIRLGDQLRWMVEDKGPLMVTIAKFRHPKTHTQNAKLHAMIDELAMHIGYTSGELKAYLKEELGPHRIVKVGNDECRVPLSVSEYSREQVSAMIEHLYRIAAEAGYGFEEAG